jgi:hypothetical protein
MNDQLIKFIEENKMEIDNLLMWLEHDEHYNGKLNPFYGYNYADTVSERLNQIKQLTKIKTIL